MVYYEDRWYAQGDNLQRGIFATKTSYKKNNQ
jgi:hypothetical protein